MSRAGGMYRCYTCSNKARQGKTGCEGRSIPIDRLDHLVANHLEERVLQPERLEIILASVLDRRQERTERRRDAAQDMERAKMRVASPTEYHFWQVARVV